MSFPRSSAPRRRVPRMRPAQRGVILVITLVAMVVLLVGLAAILRTVDTSSLVVGNLAFRRDLTNRVEQAIAAAKVTLQTSSFDFTTDAMSSSHYSAVKLANGATGVPAILDSSSYASTVGSDITDSSVTGDSSVAFRYVIDRQCKASTTTFSTASCEYITFSSTTGGSAQLSSGSRHIADTSLPIYRISVRVTGPRNSVAYFQTTYVIK